MSINTTSFWVLSVLAGGPQHGYGALKAITELSEGAVRVQVGALYRTIDRLDADGLIEIDHEEIVDGRERRYYRLTDTGRGELKSAIDELTAMTAVATKRLQPAPAPKASRRPALGATFA